MTDLERQKEQERLLQERRPELRSRQEMDRFRDDRKRRGMIVSAIVLAAVNAFVLLMITFYLREKTRYLDRGVPPAYWIACALALALSLLLILAGRKITARREERDRGERQLLTEESLIRDGRTLPWITAASRVLPLLLFLLWLLKYRLPYPAIAPTYPFIVPIAYSLLVISLLVPIREATDASRLGRAIRKGNYSITEDLLCDREHIVTPGGKDEKDSHDYYLFYRSGLNGEMEREKVVSAEYEKAEIGQTYYRFQKDGKKLKVVDRRRVRLDSALRAHLQGGEAPEEEPVSVEDEEIRREVDRLRVGQRPEPEPGPVPEDMDPETKLYQQREAAHWLRRYDAARGWIIGLAAVQLLLLAASFILRFADRRIRVMSGPVPLLFILLPVGIAVAEMILLTGSMRHLEKARAAFPYENGELDRREKSGGMTVLIGMLGFVLLFAVLISVLL